MFETIFTAVQIGLVVAYGATIVYLTVRYQETTSTKR
jgi:hypothetical protein